MNPILRDDIEYIVHCEEDGTIIGPISKEHAHLKGVREVLYHYSTRSMVFNPILGKYGIQLKNPKKGEKYSGGKRDIGVAGHNCYIKDEKTYRYLDFNENLIKEAGEEIGLDLKMHNHIDSFLQEYKQLKNGSIGYIFDKFSFSNFRNREFIGLGFIISCETDLHFTDDEVIDFQRLTPKELKEFIGKEENICIALPSVYKKAEEFRKKYLS